MRGRTFERFHTQAPVYPLTTHPLNTHLTCGYTQTQTQKRARAPTRTHTHTHEPAGEDGDRPGSRFAGRRADGTLLSPLKAIPFLLRIVLSNALRGPAAAHTPKAAAAAAAAADTAGPAAGHCPRNLLRLRALQLEAATAAAADTGRLRPAIAIAWASVRIVVLL